MKRKKLTPEERAERRRQRDDLTRRIQERIAYLKREIAAREGEPHPKT